MLAVEIFSILSGLTLLVSFLIYFQQIKKGISTPNLSSWLIGLFIMAINVATYQEIILRNPIKVCIGYVALVCIVLVCVYCIATKSFSKIHAVDLVAFIIAVASGIYWQYTDNAFNAQIALQVTLLISYLPIYVGVFQGRIKEGPLFWLVVVLAYVFSTLAVIFSFDQNWIELLFPVLNGVIGNGLVVFLTYVRAARIFL